MKARLNATTLGERWTARRIARARARYRPRIIDAPAAAYDDRLLRRAAIGLVVLATVYNAILAIVNAHLHPLTSAAVVLSEVLILFVGLLVIARSGLSRADLPHIGLLAAYLVLALISSIGTDMPFLDPVRNFAIIAVFAMLGSRASEKDVKRTFLILTITILLFLVLDMASVDAYVGLFQPDTYYQATRGVAKSQYNDTGLVANSLGFASRFSFGIFTSHRTSSLFLEQVSLANYAGVLCIFLVALWKRLDWRSRILHVGTVLLILVSNNTRTSSGLALVFLIGYFLFPLLPRYLTLLIAPSLLALAFIVVGGHPVLGEDDLRGRLSITVETLRNLNVTDLLGLNVGASRVMYDTGYGYILVSSGLLGLLILWLYVSLIVPATSAARRRCAFALVLYVFLNMLIGGTAIYSMKIAAALWLLIGFVVRDAYADSGDRAPLPVMASA